MQDEEIDREIRETIAEIQKLQLKLKSLYAQKKSALEKIPADLILNFSKFLDARDISRLGSAQKHLHEVIKHDYLWANLLKDRFNEKVENGRAYDTFKDLYRKSTKLNGVDLSVIWMDGQHWRSVANSIELLFVWWFEVRGAFRGVKAGSYTPILKGKFSKAHSMENVKIWIRASNQVLTEFSFSQLSDNSTRDELRLEEIRVGDERGYPVYQDLQLEILDVESNTVKQGIRIDCIILKPLTQRV